MTKGSRVTVPPEAAHWSLVRLTADAIEAMYRMGLACLARRPADDAQRLALERGEALFQFGLQPDRGVFIVGMVRPEGAPEIIDVISIDADDAHAFGHTARELLDDALKHATPV